MLGAMAAHAWLARAVSSPWVVPDLTLVGLVLSVAKTPVRWFACSVIAGLFMMGWAVRFPAQVFLSYVTLGWLVRALGRQWDATDPRVQTVMIGAASLLLTGGALWLEDLWSLSLFGWAMVRVALTVLAVPCARHLAGRP